MVASLNDPFLCHKLDDTVVLPAGDVPELHAEVLDRCRSLLSSVHLNQQGLGLLVVGETGSGKSHLIAQLRQQLGAVSTVALASVSMKGAYAGNLWRHLRKNLVTELLRPYGASKPNGLLRILQNQFSKWAAVQESSGGMLDWVLGRSPARFSLQPYLDEFARLNPPFDNGLLKVLPKVGAADLTTVAHSWLLGQQLGADDLERLGLPPRFPSEQQQEFDARDVVLSILRLAGSQTKLFICIDEVERIQASNFDAPVLREFSSLLTDLVAYEGPRIIATFVRPNTQVEMSKAVEVSTIRKIGQIVATIPPLTWEQSVRVVAARLDAEPTCRTARQVHAGNTFWPLSAEFLERTFREHRRNMTPRHLILACAVEFQRIQKGKPNSVARPSDPGGEVVGSKPGSTASEEFRRVWEGRRNKMLERLQGIQFDNVMAIGLPWLTEVLDSSLIRIHDFDKRLEDVNLVFQPTEKSSRKPVGISICNHEPRSLWRRLDRLLKQWNENKSSALGTLTALRFDPWPQTDAVAARLEALAKAGINVLLVDRLELAEFAAFQLLFSKAQAGELTRGGKPIEAAEYSGWAKDNLSPAVRQLLAKIFSHASADGHPVAPTTPAATTSPPAQAAPAPKKRAAAKAKK